MTKVGFLIPFNIALIILSNLSAGSTKRTRNRSKSLTSGSHEANIIRGPTFTPDYTVRALTDVVYFRISNMLYQAACNATFFDKIPRGHSTTFRSNLAEYSTVTKDSMQHKRNYSNVHAKHGSDVRQKSDDCQLQTDIPNSIAQQEQFIENRYQDQVYGGNVNVAYDSYL